MWPVGAVAVWMEQAARTAAATTATTTRRTRSQALMAWAPGR